MSDKDLISIKCEGIPKIPQDLIICIDDICNVGIKSVCFRFKDQQIVFSRDEILDILIKLRQGNLR